MPRTLIGLDYDGVGCVKVTKDGYDPVTTPDSNSGAFLYNSKTAVDFKITAVLDPAVIWSAAGTGESYLPAGSNAGNALAACLKAGDNLQMACQVGYTGENFYNMPLFDVKKFNTSTARFVQGRFARQTYGTQNRGVVYLLRNDGLLYEGFASSSLSWWSGTKANTLALSWYYSGALGYEKDIGVIWRLPGDSTAVLDGTPKAPVPGQRTLEINGSACRVAKPGYDVRVATKTQLAFDSSSNPAKVVAAGDISVPVGSSEHDTGFAIPAGALVDVHFYTGSTIYYPANPIGNINGAIIGADYWIDGTKLRFVNDGQACRARFIVYAYDASPQTAGSYSVIRQATIGGVGVVQLVRPGAGANPSFADIIMDTRWPSLRILAEGYLPVTADGEQSYEINFDAAGMLPMVKFCTVHAGQSGSVSFSKVIRTPRVRVVFIDPQEHPVASWIGGDTCYCTLTATKATFKTFRGNPTRVSYASVSAAETDSRSYLYDTNAIQGVRYYIFGIPL